jgi:hypothetical protein
MNEKAGGKKPNGIHTQYDKMGADYRAGKEKFFAEHFDPGRYFLMTQLEAIAHKDQKDLLDVGWY